MMEHKPAVLFVDDEKNILDGMRRKLRGLRRTFDMDFANSGQEGLAKLKEGNFNIIMTDLYMPEMNGVQLLTEVTEHNPELTRIVLSGYADEEMILKATLLAHRFLSKPSDEQTIIHTLQDSYQLIQALQTPELTSLVNRLTQLPVVPEIYQQIRALLQQADCSIDKIAELINQDMGLSAKILQLANSAFFNRTSAISSIKEATVHLGINAIRCLFFVISLFDRYQFKQTPICSMQELWEHSNRVANLSKRIAEAETDDNDLISNTHMAGLLHDVGLLLLASEFTDECQSIKQMMQAEERELARVEQDILGVSHHVLGAYLLRNWGLPDNIVSAVAIDDYQQINKAGFNVEATVYLANAIDMNHHQGACFENIAMPDKNFMDRYFSHSIEHYVALYTQGQSSE